MVWLSNGIGLDICIGMLILQAPGGGCRIVAMVVH